MSSGNLWISIKRSFMTLCFVYIISKLKKYRDNMFKRSEERKNTRLKGHDYTRNGYYFVTICVEDMEHRFGFIENRVTKLNKFGKIAQRCLNDLPKYYHNCFLDETVIMPNHIHCIIVIDNESVGDVSHTSPEIHSQVQTIVSTNANVEDVSHTSPIIRINNPQNTFSNNILIQKHEMDNILIYNAIKEGTNGNRPPTGCKTIWIG
jgi:hypothetical protein